MTWQPIETAPHETTVLLYSPPVEGVYDGKIEVGFASSGRRWAHPSGGVLSNMSWHGSATHWMPLPHAPGSSDRTNETGAQSEGLNQTLPDPVAAEREALEQARRDIQCLLSIIEYVEEATGGGPEDEDAALVAQIRTSYECGLDSPEAIRARGTDGGTNG